MKQYFIWAKWEILELTVAHVIFKVYLIQIKMYLFDKLINGLKRFKYLNLDRNVKDSS